MTFDFLKLLKVIEEMQLDFFSTSDLSNIVELSSGNIQNYLETLANNELITRIEKGKYCRIYIRDKFIIGSKIIEGGVISHQSALALHEIDYDTPGEVFISSCHQKNSKTLFGTQYKFIRIRPHKNFGAINRYSNNCEFKVTDLEKTILDCFDLPQHVSSYSKLLEKTQDLYLDQKKLFEYGLRMKNLSVLKRLAFLFEQSNPLKYSFFLKKVESIMNQKYTLLVPGGIEKGPFNNKWHVRNNLN